MNQTLPLSRKKVLADTRFIVDLEYDAKRETHIFTAEQFREEFTWAEREKMLWHYERSMPFRLQRMRGTFAITLRKIQTGI